MEEGFFNPYQEVSIHERNLPHWQQPGVLVFLTWRLADALPETLLSSWRAELRVWREHYPEPWDEAARAEYHRLFSTRIKRCLDAGHGASPLRDARFRSPVEQALRHYGGRKYELPGFVIMPNHVHLVARPSPDVRIEQLIRGWKSWSGREVNRLQDTSGEVWQSGYWDRLVRDQEHLTRCLNYIQRNPIKAALAADEYTLWIRPGKCGSCRVS